MIFDYLAIGNHWGKMKKSINLNKREFGPWANFECYLLNDEHAGFIEWQHNNLFRLKKTPFSEHYSPYLYYAPEDVTIPEQGLIKLKVGELQKSIRLKENSTYGAYTNQIYNVEGYEEIKTDSLPKPSITKDEFLSYVVGNWHGAENHPLFKKEIAYNILSCQKDFFGTGGIGVGSFVPTGGSQTLKFLKSSIGYLLPDEFKKRNETFEYDFITQVGENKITNDRRNNPHSNEISFNDMSKLPNKMVLVNIPVQIPLILPDDVIYHASDSYNRDVLDYQLRALLVKPIIQPDYIEKFTDLAMQTSEYIDKNYTEETLLVDSLAHIKIACASCRLELKDRFEEDMLPRIKDELLQMFKEYADTYHDRMVAGGGARWNIPMQPLSEKHNLTIDANKVYREMLEADRQNKEVGLTWMSFNEIKNRPNLKYIGDFALQKALTELNNAILILQRKNLSEFLIVSHKNTE